MFLCFVLNFVPLAESNRWRPDVYSAEVLGARKARLVEEVHTKAVYELRRFSARLKDAVLGS